MSYIYPDASLAAVRPQRTTSGAKWFLFLCLALASLSVPAQKVLPTPAPELYGVGLVYNVLRQPDGRVIAGGEFTSADGLPVRYVVRYEADGTPDGSYTPALDGFVDDMALDSQGRLYVMQRATMSIGLSTAPATGFPFVRRIDATGQVDESFVPPPPANAFDHGLSMLLDEEGGALYASYSVLASPNNRVVVRRYHLSDGSLDEAFQLDAEYLVNDMIRSGDQIVLAGSFRDINGVARRGLARVDRLSGTLDQAWDPAATALGTSLTVRKLLQDGTHVLVGSANVQNIGGGTNRGLARISLIDGSADPAWNIPVAGTVTALAKDSQGRVLVFGFFSQINGAAWNSGIARFSATGQHEAAWGDASIAGSTLRSLVVLPGDVVLSAQSGSTGDTVPRLLLHAADTGLATEFATNILGTPRLSRAFAVGSDTLLAGPILTIDGVSGVGAVRIDASGAGVPGWHSTYGSQVIYIQVADAAISSQHLYLTGFISALNNAPNYFPVRRLSLADGALDTGWNPQMASPGSAGNHRVAVDEEAGLVYVFGSNLSSNPANRYLARFGIDDGTLDASWGPGALTSVQQMMRAGGFVYIAGNFTTVGGVDLPRLARIPVSGSGTPDAAWRPAPVAATAIAFDEAGGWVYAGGSSANGIELARYRLSDATRDAEWAPLAGRAGSIARLVFDAPSGSLYVIGDLGAGCNGGKLSALRLYSGPTRLDPRWRAEFDRYGAAADVLPRADGSALVVGYFDRINGEPRQSTAAVGQSDSIYADGMGTGDNGGGCVQ